VMARTSFLMLGGSGAGFLLGLAGAPLLAKVVYQASPRDPSVVAAVSLAMIAISLVAAWGPVRRALQTDPVIALRQE